MASVKCGMHATVEPKLRNLKIILHSRPRDHEERPLFPLGNGDVAEREPKREGHVITAEMVADRTAERAGERARVSEDLTDRYRLTHMFVNRP